MRALLKGVLVGLVIMFVVIAYNKAKGADMKQTRTVVMHPARTTPGTYLYEVAGAKKLGSPMTNAYVKKEAFGDGAPPSELKVTLEWDDGK
jgi:hypothetical protein